jgi:hypothetical protein
MGSLHNFFSSLLRSSKPSILHLGVFGKHPGWDDHMDDFGIDAEEILAAKQILYNQGIGGAIDSGLWEGFEQPNALLPFGHWLLWRSGETSIFGRLWVSSDRKGRSRYPMVVCLQFNRSPSPEWIQLLTPKLEDFQRACQETQDAAVVLQTADRLRQDARDAFGRWCQLPNPQPVPLSVTHPACTPQEWLHLVYALDSQLARFGKKSGREQAGLTVRSVDAAGECESLRLPVCPLAPTDAILYWNRVVDHWVAPEASCLFLLPDHAHWMDLLVGRPSSKNFFCLKAPGSLVPLTSQIPFELPPEFTDCASRHLTEIFGPDAEPVSLCRAPSAGDSFPDDPPGTP